MQTNDAVYVVTGCTQGLGYFCVKNLAADPNVISIVLACRNLKSAQKAADKIAKASNANREKLVVLNEPLNLSDIDWVRAYCLALAKFLGNRKITSLINNAGIGGNPSFRKSKQGFDEIWTTNHLGHFLLTTLLLKHMGQNSRIVNVSSEVHDPEAKTGLPDPGQHWPETIADYDKHLAEGEPVADENASTSGSRRNSRRKVMAEGEPVALENASISGNRRYSRSKLCNVLFTNELALRLSGAIPHGVDEDAASKSRAAPQNRSCKLPAASSVQVVAMNPGLMLDTGFVTAIGGSCLGGLVYLLSPLIRYLTPLGKIMRTGAESGKDLAELAKPAAAVAEAGAAVTAAYYDGTTLKPSSAFSRAADTVARRQGELWEHSVRWARLTPEELAAAGF